MQIVGSDVRTSAPGPKLKATSTPHAVPRASYSAEKESFINDIGLKRKRLKESDQAGTARIPTRQRSKNYAFNAVHIGTYQQARFTGIIEVQVMVLNYYTMKRIFVEVGSDHLRRHWREIHCRLSRQQNMFGQQYGGVWLGGLVVEDPSPTPGRGHDQRFIRFAVDGNTRQRVEVHRQQLPTFRRDYFFGSPLDAGLGLLKTASGLRFERLPKRL
ncbi:hypothetical protein MP228_004615 [Amoeboaphelidium protococcarum]|nr:hypothetical protein MP228_004615 [Amoeboaphelidium protococcarum]